MTQTRLIVAAALALVTIGALTGCGAGGSRDHRSSVGAAQQTDAQGRLLALRVVDPEGGAPWGMRIVRTPGGLVCAQVGRVHDGIMGGLGVDGAFNDDGRFHPFAQNSFSQVTVAGLVGDDGACVAEQGTFDGIIYGLDRNAVDNPLGQTIPMSDRREIAYGLLGSHARTVTYRDGTRLVTTPVIAGLGAYLVVRVAKQARYLGTTGAAPGSDSPGELQLAGPTGFIRAVTYQFGQTVCRDAGGDPIARCHLVHRVAGGRRTPRHDGT
jgi:hypothetical protein